MKEVIDLLLFLTIKTQQETNGELAVFKIWNLVGGWNTVTRTHNQFPEDTTRKHLIPQQ